MASPPTDHADEPRLGGRCNHDRSGRRRFPDMGQAVVAGQLQGRAGAARRNECGEPCQSVLAAQATDLREAASFRSSGRTPA